MSETALTSHRSRGLQEHDRSTTTTIAPDERLPLLLTAQDAADLLRTSRKAVYSMIERAQLPGVVRIGRRVLVRRDDLLEWLRQKSTLSLERSER